LSSEIDWASVLKKKVSGLNGEDFGEILKVDDNSIIIGKGLIDKVFFSIPKNLVKDYDGDTLRLKITEQEAINRFTISFSPKEKYPI
jgi:hypothetical protein